MEFQYFVLAILDNIVIRFTYDSLLALLLLQICKFNARQNVHPLGT